MNDPARCLPSVPTHQGTQAALAAMLDASTQTGQETQLLAYAHFAYRIDTAYAVHRIADFPKVRSLRSGPSWGKVVLDARCVFQMRRLARRLRPRAVVAHHIEAALATLCANVTPVYYMAHTRLAQELPHFLPRLPPRLVSGVAARVEQWICQESAGVCAVSPLLAQSLHCNALYVPVPWKLASSSTLSKKHARMALGIHPNAPTCLFAGNLDPYQGWEQLLEALGHLRRSHRDALLLIATESDIAPARAYARRLGVGASVRFIRLNGERARVLSHTASDVAWVPRAVEGGLSIKMLDAFARKVPVVTMERAKAGFAIDDSCIIVPNDSAIALANGARHLLETPEAAHAISERACHYLSEHHSIRAFCEAMHTLLSDAPSPATSIPTSLSTYRPTRSLLDPS